MFQKKQEIHPAMKILLYEAEHEYGRDTARLLTRIVSTVYFMWTTDIAMNFYSSVTISSIDEERLDGILFVSGLFVLAIGWSIFLRESDRRARRIVTLLNGRRDFNGYIELMKYEDPVLHDLLVNGLANLLSTVVPEEVPTIKLEVRKLMLHEFNYSNLDHRFEVVSNLVIGVATYGSTLELKALKRMSEVIPKSNLEERLRTAVFQSLPQVERRAEIEKTSSKLLRASSSNTLDPTVLLRSAHSNAPIDPLTMLRSVEEPQ